MGKKVIGTMKMIVMIKKGEEDEVESSKIYFSFFWVVVCRGTWVGGFRVCVV